MRANHDSVWESVVFIHDRLFDFMASLKPIVMKFGGTSVGDAQAVERVTSIVASQVERRPVVVVSAMSGMTNALVEAAGLAQGSQPQAAGSVLEPHFARHLAVVEKLLTKEARETVLMIKRARAEVFELLELIAGQHAASKALRDAVLSYGEQLSSLVLAAVLRERRIAAQQVDARRCLITNEEFGCALPLMTETMEHTQGELGPLLEQSFVPVLGGFIGATVKGETTTIGRGGSDYTAAIIGAALRAREIQIWTDVTGVLTADPRVVPTAHTIPRLSYAEAAELAYFGAKVLHPKTIQPAVEGDIPVRICNSRAPEAEGTLVCAESETSPHTVKAIAHKKGVTTVQITSARMLGAYGFLRALFAVFEQRRTIVDVVTTSEVSVSLSLDDDSTLPAIVADLEALGTVTVERQRAIVCVVGEGLRGTPGIAARVFNTISDINVTLISQGASSINLTFAIAEAQVEEAVNRLHEAFFAEVNLKSELSPAFSLAQTEY
jgi:aspartate kinase